eukprot:Skav215003  [mRNA]  locus=scaffold508:1249069:1249604:+ [translate_table: standard]
MGKRGQSKATAAQGTLPPALIKRFKSVVGYQATAHGDKDVLALREKYEQGTFEEKLLESNKLEILKKFEEDGKLKWASDFIVTSEQQTKTGTADATEWLTAAQIAKEENLNFQDPQEKEVIMDICSELESRQVCVEFDFFKFRCLISLFFLLILI